MDTGLLKGFAAGARVDLIKEVGARLDVVLGSGSVARAEAPGAVAALERAVGKDGREAVVDRVAYTWFNRIIALRFMDANGYTGVGVVSPEPGKIAGQPQVLSDAKGGDFDADVVSAKTQATVTALLNDTRPSTDPQGEAYGLLLEAYCRFWNKAMPFMFEREGDYTELLMPTALLATDSVRDRAVRTLTDEVCGEVEVIGWLYQFYISERKDEVFAGFKKNKKAGAAEIPAATQLFTPHWIVRYLVENSLGRLWLLNHPESQLAEQMDYYIPPVDEETDFLRVSSPEELKIVDPAAGSGHMLTYAFDLLYAIYEEQAYSPSEIPSKILEHNLYGAEIDPRAGALAAFALTMKAAKKRKLFLKNPVQPHICVLENVRFDQADLDYLWSLTSGTGVRSEADAFWNAFEHADTFGSLIEPNETLIATLHPKISEAEAGGDLLHADVLRKARVVLSQSVHLGRQYSVLIANPPYLGTRKMTASLVEFAQKAYPSSKVDLFFMFMVRAAGLVRHGGVAAMITMQSWMFLSSFEAVRRHYLTSRSLLSVAHLGSGAFDSIGGEVVSTAAFTMSVGGRAKGRTTYLRLVDGADEAAKSMLLRREIGESLPTSVVKFVHEADWFAQLPGSQLVYWLPKELVSFLSEPRTIGAKVAVRQGMATTDNARFLRSWWEVSMDRTRLDASSRVDAANGSERWFPYNKGGTSRRWFGNHEHVIDWYRDGEAIRATPGANASNLDLQFRPSVSWSKVSTAIAFRAYPAGFLFDVAGTSLFPPEASRSALTGYLNSEVVRVVLNAISPTINYEVGHVSSLPMITDSKSESLVDELVAIHELDWHRSETSWGFSRNRILGDGLLLERYQASVEEDREVVSHVRELESENDRVQSAAVGLDVPLVSTRQPTLNANYAYLFGADKSQDALSVAARATAAKDLVSYGVGATFGRYSLDLPGLVLANQGDSLQEYLAKVPSPSFIPDADGVIPVVDGEWFEDDIVATFRQFLRVAFGEDHFEENLKFVIDSLGVKDLRDYFVKSFYKDHVQRYKKRPIYWMFSSPKGSFNALVYLHRYNPSTVSTVLNEYLREFIRKLEVSLEQQERVVVSGANAREVTVAQKEADRLRKVLIELGDYERDLYDLASRQIDLDLDDGVLVNYQKFGSALKDIGLKKGGESA